MVRAGLKQVEQLGPFWVLMWLLWVENAVCRDMHTADQPIDDWIFWDLTFCCSSTNRSPPTVIVLGSRGKRNELLIHV